MRIQPLITVQTALVEFSLVISPLKCDDRGRYQCRAVTAFGDPTASILLIIKQPPGTPQVTYKHHSWTLNTTLSVLCEAEAGIPPQEFLWYFKKPNMRNFQIVERQNEAVYHHEAGCRVTSRRALHVKVTSESRGTTYRCALPGRVEEQELYDEIQVQLLLLPGSSADTRMLHTSSCTDSTCQLNVDTNVGSRSNQQQASYVTVTLIGCGLHVMSLVTQFIHST
ncbi:uncharacterized protein [Littorina saxatilis]|uniref:uncharacterized protein n=1 Tax=Littorina saxatilis TaxID=31220 RepID=UPI0038B6A479